MAELSRIIRWDERGRWQVPYTLEEDWAAKLDALDSAFGPVQRYDTGFAQPMDVDTLVARVLSTSSLASRPEAERADLARRVRDLVAHHDEPFDLPYRTTLYWCRRDG